MRIIPVVLGLAFPVSSAIAQQSANPPDTRSVMVGVLESRGGAAVSDLTKENFQLRVNGKPLPVLAAQYSRTPRRIVILLDVSASMTSDGYGSQSNEWKLVREALADFLQSAPADVPIAMATFSNTVQEVFDFSQGRGAISNWLNEGLGKEPKFRGKKKYTALYDSILEGLKLLQTVQPGDALYAITDGGDNISHASPAHVTDALLHSGVRLFALCLQPTSFITYEEQTGLDALFEVADDTGGATFTLADTGNPNAEPFFDQRNRERARIYARELNTEIDSSWTLKVAVPEFRKQAKLALEVVDTSGKARKDIFLLYPHSLPSN
jgi:hypothetical protein